MDFQLVVVRGRSASDALTLIDGVNTVGRHDECQIRIKSSQVSRRHCELFEKKGLLIVKDLGSSNGTLVNGKRIEGQSVLEPGDELTIGGVKLRVAKVGEAVPAPKVPSKAANDTAVVEAILVDDSPDSGEDEFEIDFDDEPASISQPVAAAPKTTPISPPPRTTPTQPAPTPPSTPSVAKSDGNRKAPESPKVPVPQTHVAVPEVADEAIADFLLDLKIDEDE